VQGIIDDRIVVFYSGLFMGLVSYAGWRKKLHPAFFTPALPGYAVWRFL
jgi:hypothetical protein